MPEAETLEHAEGIGQALPQGPLSEHMMPNSAHRTELSQLQNNFNTRLVLGADQMQT